MISSSPSTMSTLICSNPDCNKRIKAKGRELCATCWRKLTPEGRDYNCKRQQAYQQRVREHFAAEQ
jgi:hypothetical protein